MKYKKSLGQHILVDEEVARFMVEAAGVGNDDDVLEIGPGTGVLTRYLLDNSKQVMAVELDRRMVSVLEEKFKSAIGNSKLEIKEEDALGFLDSMQLNSPSLPPRFKVVASLPYNVGTAIIRKLVEIDRSKGPSVIVVLLQKEVVERICSVGDKGSILSNAVQYYGEPEMLLEVSPDKFDPPPKVTSAVLKIENFKKRDPREAKKFFQLVKLGFASKRRTLVNNLSTGYPQMEKAEIEKILEEAGLEKMVRAEHLKLEDWEGLIESFNQ